MIYLTFDNNPDLTIMYPHAINKKMEAVTSMYEAIQSNILIAWIWKYWPYAK